MPKYHVTVWYSTIIEDHFDAIVKAKNTDEAEAKARVLAKEECDVFEILDATTEVFEDVD